MHLGTSEDKKNANYEHLSLFLAFDVHIEMLHIGGYKSYA